MFWLEKASFFLAFCEYVLMAPSEEYRPFMDAMKEKTYISKVMDKDVLVWGENWCHSISTD
jgi:hypothetical protein